MLTRRSAPTSGLESYDTVAWAYVKSTPLWNERFGQNTPKDFYEKGRLAWSALDDLKIFEAAKEYCGRYGNFLDPKFSPIVFFKCIRKIYVILKMRLESESIDRSIIRLLAFEAFKLLVPRKKRENPIASGKGLAGSRVPLFMFAAYDKVRLELIEETINIFRFLFCFMFAFYFSFLFVPVFIGL